MTSLHVICGLAPPPNPKSWIRLCIKPCAMCIPDTGCCIFVLLRAPSLVVAYSIAKAQNIRSIASIQKVLLVWKYGMEYGRKFQYGVEYGKENFSIEWKWNGRKLPVWNMEKSCSILFHALLLTRLCKNCDLIMFKN